MALQGTIKDFGLADIFQLIGIQRKSGLLTLDSGREEVTVKFLEGQVVGADTRSQSVEDLLGQVLVRTGRITEAQLAEALRMQKQTLQRLGHLLVRRDFISEDDLVEALRVQSLQIVYRLFRWRDGRYNFRTSDTVEYDDRHFTPISAETILMEGARMIDEWPIIERRIKSDRSVFRQTDAAQGLDLRQESLVDGDPEIDFGFGEGDAQEGGRAGGGADGSNVALSLSPDERQVLRLVDGRRTVEEINDLSGLGEFDTCRILCELITRNLLEEVRRATAGEVAIRPRRLTEALVQGLLVGVMLLTAAVSLATLRDNGMTPWRVTAEDEATESLRLHASQERLERIERAIEVFYLDAGVYPDNLRLLADHDYLAERDLLDPWGRGYGFRLSAGGYQLVGTDAGGEPSRDLTVSRTFSAAQRMMAAGMSEEPAH